MWDKETQTVSISELVIDFFDEEEFVKDNQKVKYYTGLSNGELLMEVFKLVVPFHFPVIKMNTSGNLSFPH